MFVKLVVNSKKVEFISIHGYVGKKIGEEKIHGKGGKIITPTLCLIEIKFKQGEDKNDEIPRISQKRLLYSMETWG